jgi:tRNA-specific 2-thiouridylase
MARVFVGMSGGVDSSLTAALLVEQGHDVTGVYMKNWSEDLPGMKCPWAEDLADAKRVAVQLGIDFLVFDFEKDYRDRVVQYMIDEYKRGRTPNPDIMCNQEIKFRLFFDTAVSHGAEYIATGHYARTKDGQLLQAVDSDKDQTYFLYRVSKQALLKRFFHSENTPKVRFVKWPSSVIYGRLAKKNRWEFVLSVELACAIFWGSMSRRPSAM